VRATEWRNLEELQRNAQRQHQEAERRQRQEESEREAQKRLQAALRQTQEQLRETEQRLHEEKECEKQRQGQSEQAERLHQAEQQRAEQRRRQAEEEREAQRKRRREHKRVTAQFKSDWWIVLGVAPSASKDEIVRKYRHKIKQCHPDRLVGVAPDLLQLAEEQAKDLNEAYANAMRTRRHGTPDVAAA
jgi:DnaJ-domain-containing protein 1